MNNFFFNNLSKNYFLFLIIFSSYTLPAFSESGVSVFMYHRFGEDKYPSTNVSEEQFFSHIDYILSNEIKVIKLEELIEDLDQNKEIVLNIYHPGKRTNMKIKAEVVRSEVRTLSGNFYYGIGTDMAMVRARRPGLTGRYKNGRGHGRGHGPASHCQWRGLAHQRDQ